MLVKAQVVAATVAREEAHQVSMAGAQEEALAAMVVQDGMAAVQEALVARRQIPQNMIQVCAIQTLLLSHVRDIDFSYSLLHHSTSVVVVFDLFLKTLEERRIDCLRCRIAQTCP